MHNKERYPEAWAFFIKEARNITEEPDLKDLGNYRIPKPDRSGSFIYTNSVEMLWYEFIRAWFTPALNSECVRSKIQYIVQNF